MDVINFSQSHHVILGDSHVRRIPGDYFIPGNVNVHGYSGADSKRLKEVVAVSSGHCREVVVMAGANDALKNRSPWMTERAMIDLIMDLAARCDRLTVMQIFHMPAVNNTITTRVNDSLERAFKTAKVRLARSKCSTNLDLATPMWTASSDFDREKDSVHLHWKSQRRFSRYMANFLKTYCTEEEPVVLPIPESPDVPPIMSPSPMYSPPLLCPSPTSHTTPTVTPAVTPLVKEPTTLLTSSHAVGSPSRPSEWHSPKRPARMKCTTDQMSRSPSRPSEWHSPKRPARMKCTTDQMSRSPSRPSEWHSPKRPARMKCTTDQMSSISKSGCQYGIVYQHLSESNDHEDTTVTLSQICQENHAVQVATQKTRKRSRNPSPLKEYSTSPTKRCTEEEPVVLPIPESPDVPPIMSPSPMYSPPLLCPSPTSHTTPTVTPAVTPLVKEPTTLLTSSHAVGFEPPPAAACTSTTIPEAPCLPTSTPSTVSPMSTSSTVTPSFSLANLSPLRSTKVTVNGELYDAYNVPGDGSCFFNALSLSIHGDINQNGIYRNIITNHVLSNWENFEDQIHLGHDKDMTPERYVQEMQEENGWSSTVESQVATTILGIDIDIHFKYPGGIMTTHLRASQFPTNEKIMLLLESNHYKVLRTVTQANTTKHTPHQVGQSVSHSVMFRAPRAISNTHCVSRKTPYAPHLVQTRAQHAISNRASPVVPNNATPLASNRAPYSTLNRTPHSTPIRASQFVSNSVRPSTSNKAPQSVPTKDSLLISNRHPNSVSYRAPHVISNRAPRSIPTKAAHSSSNRVTHPLLNRRPQSNRVPYSAPNKVPLSAPNKVPLSVPNKVSLSAPNKVPLSAPNKVPLSAPNKVPLSAPNKVPLSAPNKVPLSAPNKVPLSDPNKVTLSAKNKAPHADPNRPTHLVPNVVSNSTAHSVQNKVQSSFSTYKSNKFIPYRAEQAGLPSVNTVAHTGVHSSTATVPLVSSHPDIHTVMHDQSDTVPTSCVNINTVPYVITDAISQKTYLPQTDTHNLVQNQQSVQLSSSTNNPCFPDHTYCKSQPSAIVDKYYAMYGINFEKSKPNESAKDKRNRKRRNTYKAKKLGIDVASSRDFDSEESNCTKFDVWYEMVPENGTKNNHNEVASTEDYSENSRPIEITSKTDAISYDNTNDAINIERENNMNEEQYVEENQDDFVMENEKDNTKLDAINQFEIGEMSYCINHCKVCKETRINMKLIGKTSICGRCYRDKNITKMFSTENNMIPSIIPSELDKLTMIEQQLISKISPCINVHMLKHGGIASSGHCVTFPQAINEVAQVFPRLPSEISIIKVRKPGLNDTSKDFRVRRYVVQDALMWLKTNNPVYEDIIISEERLALLPEDGELQNVEVVSSALIPQSESEVDLGPAQAQFDLVEDNDGETHSAVLLPEPAVDIQQKVTSIIDDIVGEGHGEVKKNRQGTLTIPWPTRSDNPLSEFVTKHFFTLAFPCLFPNGEGDFFDNRVRTCNSLSDWGDHLMWLYDGRFAHHSYFKFVLHNMINRKGAIDASNYVIHQQLGEDHISVAELKEKLNSGDDTIIQKILYFSSNIRGSSQYWAQRGKELRSLIEFQLQQGRGLPSLFVTGSCAEFYFKPLRHLLTMYVKETSGIDIDLTDPTTLFNTLQQNTHVVGHYFDLRSQHYFDTVMKGAFGVDCYWFRHEFAKSRGMIHWHGLCWRGDTEPHKFMHDRVGDGFNDDDCARLLSEWAVDEFYMTASHPAGADENGAPRKDLWPPPEGTAPAPPDEMNPLVKLLMDQCNSQESFDEDYLLLTNRINIHRCSSYCLQQKSAKHPKECRMDYGVENGEGKPLRQEPALVTDRNGCLRLEMARDHPRITQHSRLHTQAWRANGDISIIVTKSGVENPDISDILATEKYVSGYACKGNMPTGSVNILFKDMVNAVDSDEVASGKSTIMKLLISTVKRDISSVEASYELSSFPLYHCTHQFQSISLSGSRLLEKKGNKISKNSVIDRYTSRDVNDHSSLYQHICNGGKVPVITGGVQQASWPLTEYYARTTLLLHHPDWRKLSDIKEDNVTWLEALDLFLLDDQCPNFVKADIERARQGESRREEQHEEGMELDEDQPDWMEVIQPNVEYNISEVSFDDGGEDYDWTLTSRDYPSDLGEGWIDMLQQMGHSDEMELPDVDITLLNADQQFVFNLVMYHVVKYKEGSNDFHPLRLIVGGSAGSGKSFLIKCLVFAIKAFFQTNSCVQVLCPTGNSANIISGVTMHSFLKLPISTRSKELSPPEGLIGKALQCNCDGVEVLLVDERSLIGATTLGWMEYMCRYGMYAGAHSDESWGGLPVVVFFGDDVQLPPVLDSPVYNSSSKTPAAMHGVLVWQEFDNAVILSKILRQSESNVVFKEVLNSMRNYTVTSDQAKWLQQFQWNNLMYSHGETLLNAMTRDGLFVFPSSRQEGAHNTDKLIELNTVCPVVKCVAINKGQHAPSAKKERSCGLSNIVYLGKSAKVSLCVNLSVPFGLFNRATGYIVDIVYSNGKRPSSSLPTVIMVDFPTYTGPPFIASHPTIVPISPIQRSINCACHGCTRIQIPLRLAWATTIHSCQGQTVGRGQNNRYIVIHPGTNSFESHNPGALFVALSRAKCVDIDNPEPDMAWHPSVLVNEDRLCHVPNNNTIRARTKEITRIETMCQKTCKEFSFLRTSDVFQSHSQIIFNCLQNDANEE